MGGSFQKHLWSYPTPGKEIGGFFKKKKKEEKGGKNAKIQEEERELQIGEIWFYLGSNFEKKKEKRKRKSFVRRITYMDEQESSSIN